MMSFQTLIPAGLDNSGALREFREKSKQKAISNLNKQKRQKETVRRDLLIAAARR